MAGFWERHCQVQAHAWSAYFPAAAALLICVCAAPDEVAGRASATVVWRTRPPLPPCRVSKKKKKKEGSIKAVWSGRSDLTLQS